MKLSCRSVKLMIMFLCVLLFAYHLYKSMRVLDKHSRVKVPNGHETVQHKASVSRKSKEEVRDARTIPNIHVSAELVIERNNAKQYIRINGYKLGMERFPTWFWDTTFADIARLFGTQRHKMSANVPWFVSPEMQYRSSSWAKYHKTVKQDSLYDSFDPSFTPLLRDMQSQPIVIIKENVEESDLTFTVQLKDGAWAVMRPKKKQDKNSGHNIASVAAFQLDRSGSFLRHFDGAPLDKVKLDQLPLGKKGRTWITNSLEKTLAYHRVPPTVGRFVNIKTEIEPLASKAFRRTIFTLKDGRTCFYGTCAGCSRETTSSCGTPDSVEVSLTYLFPNYSIIADGHERAELLEIDNPWMKVKRGGEPNTDWVSEKFMCTRARIRYEMGRVTSVELLDAVYFDLLIDNSERYHYTIFGHFETPPIPMMFEHGNAFRNACDDKVLDDFLYNRGGCCLMKKSTFIKYLKLLLGPISLGTQMKFNTLNDITGLVLHNDHMTALDRRVNKTIGFIIECLKKHDFDDVIINDVF